eukprot:CFRG1826T1
MSFVSIALVALAATSSTFALSVRRDAVCESMHVDAYISAATCDGTPGISIDAPTDGSCQSVSALGLSLFASVAKNVGGTGYDANIYMDPTCSGVAIVEVPPNYQLGTCIQIQSTVGAISLIGSCNDAPVDTPTEPIAEESSVETGIASEELPVASASGECCACPMESMSTQEVSETESASESASAEPSMSMCCPCEEVSETESASATEWATESASMF